VALADFGSDIAGINGDIRRRLDVAATTGGNNAKNNVNRLKFNLEPVNQRQRNWRKLTMLTIWWSLGALAGGIALLRAHGGTELPAALPWIIAGILALGTFVILFINLRRGKIDYQQLARDIEAEHPELHAALLTAIEQKPDPESGQYHYLQQRVIDQAMAAYEQTLFANAVPTRKLNLLRGVNTVILALIATALFSLPGIKAANENLSAEAKAEAEEKKQALLPAELKNVEPGNTEIERGTPLAVLAHFKSKAPANATLVIRPPAGAARRIELTKNLDDPIFGATLPSVDEPFKYHVEFNKQKSKTFAVKVFEHPTLDRADATLDYPTYTKLPKRTVEDTRRLSAVEGSKLSYQFHLNKPVKTARLVGANDEAIALQTHAGQPLAELPPLALTKSKTWKLELTDAAGRPNKIAPRIEVVVYANRQPKINITSPRGDQKVSPLEEVDFAAEVEDDFGLLRYGFTYNVNGGAMTDIPLGKEAPANTKMLATHLLALESLSVEPDQLINWFFWAEDTGPDGKVRREFSDMYFAEVRPFEEIFRQGQGQQSQQRQQQQQNKSPNQQTEELIKLQKQIINATWKLRREPGTLAKDAPVILEGQQEALKKGKVLLDKSSDEKTSELNKAVVAHMERAVTHLTGAASDEAELLPALAAEQAAYQSLLRLQAHEFQVSRQNQQQSSSQQQRQNRNGNRSQQQLNQLKLKENQKRYETEKQAQRLQEPKQREQLQVLNRLKDLARRQEDLNEKLKELENALRAAKDEEEKQEIERQLKSLRDEQRRNLADLDELNQRMEKPENRAELKQQRQQLQQTRQEMNKAAEQMQKGQLSQAVVSGTRAQKDLKEMRDDLRKKTSSQFAEQMRNMRREARELTKKQEELTKKLEQETKREPRKSLTETDDKKEIGKQLGEQQDKLDGLLKDMKDVIEKSELAEPLLNRKLYQTYRKAQQQQPEKSLKAAATLLEQEEKALDNYPLLRALDEIMEKDPDKQKLLDQLRQRDFRKASGTLSNQSRRKLDKLKQGVEKAAESVLGNEAEALKFAEKELGDLSKALKNEKAEATGGKPQEPQQGQPQQQAGKAKQPGQKQAAKPNSKSGKGALGKQKGQQNSANQPQQANQYAPQKGKPNPEGKQGKASFLQQSFQTTSNPNPITGGRHREWSDRLRDVEEAVDQPKMRERVAQVREDLRKMNAEFRRHGKEPEWNLMEQKILQPLDKLRQQIAEELAKRESDKALVPIDREPVPGKYSDLVRRYYERLGEGK